MLRYPVYPEYLPFIKTGWTLKPQNNVLSFKPDRGPNKKRRLTSAKSKILTGELLLDSKELDKFLKFYEEELKDGSINFFKRLFTTSDWEELSFLKAPVIKQNEDLSYSVSIELEVLT